VLLVLILALAACSPKAPSGGEAAAPTAVEPTTATEATSVPPTQPPATGAAPNAAAPSEPTAARPTPVPGATSAPRPDPEWQIPTVEKGEWARGPEDAIMTVVEYSDFQ